MKVSEHVKTAYMKDSVTKHLSLYFPELDKEISGAPIHQESLGLSECLVDSSSIEFVGCIASKFKINVQDLKEDVKGRRIAVKMWTDGTEDEPVPLFNGVVDSAMKQSNKRIKEITAYDDLYLCGKVDVAAWYKSLTFPITLKDLRNSLFAYIGLKQEEKELPNDDVTIKKQYDPKTLRSLDVIKAVCQINGAFGIVNREGKFEYRILAKIERRGAYPGPLLFPGPNTFPGIGASSGGSSLTQTDFAFYRTAEYEEYEVRPVDQVTIRQSEDEDGVTYGDGENNYIIQNNMFTYKLDNNALKKVAENVYSSVRGFSYYPHSLDNNGLPFAECGLDVVNYMVIDYEKTFSEDNASGDIIYKQLTFPVLNRNLTGIQSLKDNYTAKGEEYQTEFITDLQTQIDTLKKKQPSGGVTQPEMEDYAYSRDEIDEKFDSFEGGGGGIANIISVDILPIDNIQADTLYITKGMVIVE